jgi:predicted ArsR family transcriptional regulator
MRSRILRALSRFDVATVEEIASVVGLSQVNARAHLNELVAGGLADRRGQNYVTYWVTSAGIKAAKEVA